MFRKGQVYRGSRVGRPGLVNGELPDALFGDFDPWKHYQREKPRHRMIAEYAIQGVSIKDTAALVGMTPNAVSNALRQPYTRKRMIERMKQNAEGAFKQLLEEKATKALKVVSEIMEDPEVEPNARLRAAANLLDRRFGTPTQSVNMNIESKEARELSTAELMQIARRAEGPLERLPEPATPAQEN